MPWGGRTFGVWPHLNLSTSRDPDLNLIKSKKRTIAGYGSQGHAHALNLRDSGVNDGCVALRDGSPATAKANTENLAVMPPADAAAWADVVMILTPDEVQANIYHDHLADARVRDFISKGSLTRIR